MRSGSDSRGAAAADRLQTIAVASGKGGVGKSTVSLNLALSLQRSQRRVMLMDADLGLANIDVLLGLQPTRTMRQVLDGECSLAEAVTRGPDGLMVLPAASGDAGMADNPVVVGHSMGGFVSIGTAARHGKRLRGIVILDSPVSAPDPELEAARRGNIFGPLKVYPDVETALTRFRTVPEQDHYLPYVMDHVGRHSLREVEGGWSWKYDPDIFVPARSEPRVLLPQVGCRVALFRAEHGLVTPEIGEYMYDLLGRVAPVVEIPEAGHHLMLDQPLLLLTALRTLLADWEHSSPITWGGA